MRIKFRLFLPDKKAPIIIPTTEEASIAFTISGLSTPKFTFACAGITATRFCDIPQNIAVPKIEYQTISLLLIALKLFVK